MLANCRHSGSAHAQLLTNPSYSSNENARLSNKKTISPQDVMSALKDAELEEFLPRLEAELKSESFPQMTLPHLLSENSADELQSTTIPNATSATHTVTASRRRKLRRPAQLAKATTLPMPLMPRYWQHN